MIAESRRLAPVSTAAAMTLQDRADHVCFEYMVGFQIARRHDREGQIRRQHCFVFTYKNAPIAIQYHFMSVLLLSR